MLRSMCRSIKTLRTGPTPANEEAFEAAVAEVAAVSKRLLDAVALTHPRARSRA
jgi:hypothetical protein